ncbi:MAG: hypothetical protein ACI9LM_001813 [Alteromonadaceae bacterium]|jgi:hypothetical protein
MKATIKTKIKYLTACICLTAGGQAQLANAGDMTNFLDALRGFESGLPDTNDAIVNGYQSGYNDDSARTYSYLKKDNLGNDIPGRIDLACNGDVVGETHSVKRYFQKLDVDRFYNNSASLEERKRMIRKMQYSSLNAWGFVGYQNGEATLITSGYYIPETERGLSKYYSARPGADWAGIGTGLQSEATCTNTKETITFRWEGGTVDLITPQVNEWKGTFSGKSDVYQFDDMRIPAKQEQIIRALMRSNYIKFRELMQARDKDWSDILGTSYDYKHIENGQQVTKTTTITMSGIIAATHLRGALGVINAIFLGTDSGDETGTTAGFYMEMFKGHDTVFDTPSNDTVSGTQHPEMLFAGWGSDTVTTGGGEDQVVIQKHAPGNTQTTITDFSVGQDRIALGVEWTGTPLAQMTIASTSDQTGTILTLPGNQSILLQGVSSSSLPTNLDDYIVHTQSVVMSWSPRATVNNFRPTIDKVVPERHVAVSDLSAWENADGHLEVGFDTWARIEFIGLKLTDLTAEMFSEMTGDISQLGGITIPARPVITASGDTTANSGGVINVSGTVSGTSNYQWTQVEPLSPLATIANPASLSTSITLPNVGTTTEFYFQLKGVNGLSSNAASHRVLVNSGDISNNAPTAVLSSSAASVVEGGTLTLTGANSTDPDANTTLTYQWSVSSANAGSFSSSTVANPTFTAANVTADTSVNITLAVSDGELNDSASKWITVTDSTSNNSAPTAVVSASAASVEEGGTITLTGSNSTDPDTDTTLTYQWSVSPASAGSFSSTTAANPIFTAATVSADIIANISLTVNDGELSNAASASVTVTDSTSENSAPTAVVSSSAASVLEGGTVTLTGANSTDPDANTTLTYQWSVSPASAGSFSSTTTANPTFTAATVSADIIANISLTVSDGELSNAASTSVTITDGTTVTPWVAGQTVVTNGDLVSYKGSCFVAQNSPGLWEAPTSASTWFWSEVACNSGNSAPTAVVSSSSASVLEGGSVTLTGANSTDPDTNTTLTYQWSVSPASAGSFSSTTTANPTFTAANVSADTIANISLTVNDGSLSNTAVTSVTVTDSTSENSAPTAVVSSSAASVLEGGSVTLTGANSTDPDANTTLTYQWSVSPASAGSFSSMTAANPTFTAANVSADTIANISLIVSDGELSNAASTSVTITDGSTVTPWIAGQTAVTNGDLVSYSGSCFVAQNSPGLWEAPTSASTWFWTEVACN